MAAPLHQGHSAMHAVAYRAQPCMQWCHGSASSPRAQCHACSGATAHSVLHAQASQHDVACIGVPHGSAPTLGVQCCMQSSHCSSSTLSHLHPPQTVAGQHFIHLPPKPNTILLLLLLLLPLLLRSLDPDAGCTHRGLHHAVLQLVVDGDRQVGGDGPGRGGPDGHSRTLAAQGHAPRRAGRLVRHVRTCCM